VVDLDSIHEVQLDFCACRGAPERNAQLLERRLFPATTENPETAFTFRCLEFFQMLNFMGKISALDFWHSLVRLTDNTGSLHVPVSAQHRIT
jgi:hypothetical protein